jgi:hypothetical protein
MALPQLAGRHVDALWNVEDPAYVADPVPPGVLKLRITPILRAI